MQIFGLMSISLCMFAGNVFGEYLGRILGIQGNIGGVGFAMLLLLLGVGQLKKRGLFSTEAEAGIMFWSEMYIPIVIAMTAIQNVVAAVHAGGIAILGGLISVLFGFAVLKIFSLFSLNQGRVGGSNPNEGCQAVEHGCH